VIAPVAFLALTAMITLWRPPRPETMRALAEASRRPRWGWLIAHLACAAAFFPISQRALGAGQAPSTTWLAAWVASGTLVVATATALAFPLRAFRPLFQMAGRAALVGVAVAVAAWTAGWQAQALWPWLARATLNVSATLLAPLAGDRLVISVPERLLGMSDFVAWIGSPCSGAEGMGLVGVLSAAYLVKFRRTLRFPRALLVVPVAVVSAFIGNVIRIVALICVGAAISPDVAVQGFHSKAGWVMTCLITVGVLYWVRTSRWLALAPTARVAGEGENPTAAYLAPLLTSAALSLVTGLFSAGFDHLLWVRVLGTGVALLAVRGAFAGAAGRPRLAGLPVAVGMLVFVGWLAIARHADPAQVLPLQAGLAALNPGARTFWLLTRALAAVVMAPLAEELAFRGFLLRRLVRDDFWEVDLGAAARRPVPVLGSALVFGALHGAFIAGTLAGVAYALLLRRRARLGDAIVAHAVTNCLLVVHALLTDDWSLMA
jgi:exosortase E/protease (VPEID-CTERM system)